MQDNTDVQNTDEKPNDLKWKKGKIIRWAILVIVLILIAVQFINADRYEALVQVVEEQRIGVNPTGERLDFGDLPRNRESVRTVTLTSEGNRSSYIMIFKYGDIADFMRVDKSSFVLNAGTEESVEIRVSIPDSAEYRYYEGKVMVFKIPKIW